MADLASEIELLRAGLRRSASASCASVGSLAPLLARVDWDRFLWLGQQHRVLVAWRHALLPGETALVPPEILAQLRDLAEANQLQVLARARECCQLQELFASHSLDVLHLSGWALAQRHQAAPFHREIEAPTALGVAAADRPRVEAVLAAAGYPRFSPLRLQLRHKSDVIFAAPLGADRGPDGDTWRSVFARAETWSFTQRAFRLPHPHDWLLHLCAGGREHLWRPLHRIRDLAEFLRPPAALDWEAIWSRAGSLALERDLLLGVGATCGVLDQPLPTLIERRLAEHAELPAIVAALVEQVRSGAVGALPAALADRARAALGLATPSVAALADSARAPAELTDLGRYFPTPESVAERMLSLAGVGPEDVVHDLGCGDGRLVLLAAQRRGARGVGIDIDPRRIAAARARAESSGVAPGRVRFACGDLRAAALADATVVCLYLQDFAYAELLPKLTRELRPGTRIVSHRFTFPGWAPERSVLVRTAPDQVSPVHLWRIGAASAQ